MKKKILIVGGTGFIGFNLALKCLSKKWAVTSISTNKPPKNRYRKKIEYLFLDISSKQSISKKLNKRNFDYIVNCGGYVDHSKNKKIYKSHYLGCKNLADFFLNKKISCFVQLGSSVEYGKLKSPQKEKDEKNYFLKTKSFYGDAKLLATKYLLKKYNQNEFPIKILRVYLAYGPYQDNNRLIPIVVNSCLNKIKFDCSDGKQFRDFLYIEDLINLIFKSLKDKKNNGQIFNAGYGNPQKVKNIIKKIQLMCLGGKPLFGKIKMRKDEILKIYPSIQKAKKLLKWKPKYDFNQGIKKTISFYKNEKFS